MKTMKEILEWKQNKLESQMAALKDQIHILDKTKKQLKEQYEQLNNQLMAVYFQQRKNEALDRAGVKG